MNVVINLIILSVDLKTGSFYMLLKDNDFPQKEIEEITEQPITEARFLCPNVIDVASSWLNIRLINNSVIDETLYLTYGCFVPIHTKALNNFDWFKIDKDNIERRHKPEIVKLMSEAQ